MKKKILFCLPYAGGQRYSYNRLFDLLPQDFQLVTVELPGRGSRHRETLLRDVSSMVDDVLRQLSPYLNHEFIIYGHSMGAILGMSLTRKLLEQGYSLPRRLIFSGASPPSSSVGSSLQSTMSKEEFKEGLKKLGGVPIEILNDDSIMDYSEPIIRADLEAMERFTYQRHRPLDIPITILYGREEPELDRENIYKWQEETSVPIDIKELPGDHFFIFNHKDVLNNLVAGPGRYA